MISGVNQDTNSVTVEWFEKGETKGKEIELDALLRLNPDLQESVEEAQNILPSKLKRVIIIFMIHSYFLHLREFNVNYQKMQISELLFLLFVEM